MAKKSEQGTFKIPVIDFRPLSDPGTVDFQDEHVRKVSNDICEAFQKVGFAYLKNVGLSKEQVQKVFRVSEDFFALPKEKKSLYTRDSSSNTGWVALESERVNPSRPGDLKECYNLVPSKAKIWPNEVPDFQEVMEGFYAACTEVTLRILDAISYGLHLEDVGYLRNCHKIAEGKTHTTLRSLYYPPLTEDTAIKPGQIRLGEHTDYGSITLLFQDDIGGLEVKCADGQYRQAEPIPDTVLVNIADMLQMWSADKLVSTMHRVLVPEEEVRKKKKRQSVAFFVHPNDDLILESLDGSGKYPPITALDYLNSKFKSSY